MKTLLILAALTASQALPSDADYRAAAQQNAIAYMKAHGMCDGKPRAGLWYTKSCEARYGK